MAIYTRFGVPVRIVAADVNNLTLEEIGGNPTRIVRHISELRADNGIQEIEEAIRRVA